ncbi:MAG: ethanolamine ammonia-lyase [Phenylobacterium zucineum]|nr:MAG: ethanolamine ammonia-lyase [Phenylobacterium zucineum]
MTPTTRPDPWLGLRRLTPARIALGRAGASLPTAAALDFALAHARARDAVHAPLDARRVAGDLEALGLRSIEVESAAPDRATYLRRPDLGRRLSADSVGRLSARGPYDVALVVADGLSCLAVHTHAAPLVAALQPGFAEAGMRLAPVVIAHQGRVALGDEVGERLGVRLIIVLIGERPGLSSPDSLGAYITFAPRVGRLDGERNCVSNIRAEGLSHAAAALKILWITREALRMGLTGVALKDESDLQLLSAPAVKFRVGPPT